jgi:hypothetical protein
VLSILSRWLIQFCLCLDLTSCIREIFSSFRMTSLLILSSLVYPLTLLRKRISAVSRPVMSRFAVTHVSLPQSTVGLATTLVNLSWGSVRGFFKCFPILQFPKTRAHSDVALIIDHKWTYRITNYSFANGHIITVRLKTNRGQKYNIVTKIYCIE